MQTCNHIWSNLNMGFQSKKKINQKSRNNLNCATSFLLEAKKPIGKEDLCLYYFALVHNDASHWIIIITTDNQ